MKRIGLKEAATLCAVFAAGVFAIRAGIAFANPSTNPTATALSPLASSRAPEPSFRELDRQAALAKQGSETSIRALTTHLFKQAGVRPEIANAFSFNERVVQAEISYRKGAHLPVTDDSVVKSVNNLAASVGAPTWASTNKVEVRRLRMLLVFKYPHLMASQAPPDSKGRYKALDDTMSPLEASYVAVAMMQQKLLNPDFQFTDAEKTQPIFTDKALQAKERMARTSAMAAAIRQQSTQHSVRDLLHTADGFFTDLGINEVEEKAEVAK